MATHQFGRVDDKNNVYVIDKGTERLVGQYPDVSQDEALAFFTKKFDDLEAQVRILEQRISSGITDAKSLQTTHQHLTTELSEPKAVGNLEALRLRVSALLPAIEEAATKAQAARDEAVAKAMADKEEIATRAEKIVSNLGGVNWKKSTAVMAQLFERWQQIQKDSPKIPKAQTDPIWKRFSQARAKFEAGRRKYFASLDNQFKEAKKIKTELVAKAETLASKGAAAAADYRNLQDLWKKAGKAGKAEDGLWKAFRAHGDAIFAAKKELDAERDASQAENLKAKLALLAEAEKISPADIRKAKAAFSEIQSKWSRIGHVPRNEVKSVESRLRAVEQKIADAERDEWMRSDPAAKARSNQLVEQLESVIGVLEAELKGAPAAKKKEIESQIQTRKALLVAAQNAVD
ncbi:MAG: DUF349 domain-containing protein [Aquiluna sp.]